MHPVSTCALGQWEPDPSTAKDRHKCGKGENDNDPLVLNWDSGYQCKLMDTDTRTHTHTHTLWFNSLNRPKSGNSPIAMRTFRALGLFPGDSADKESAYNAGDPGMTSGSARSPRQGNGYPLQYSCLENSMDREAWQAIVPGVTKGQMLLSN